MTTQSPLDTLTRAPAGGIVGLNGVAYKGGEFLPLSARGGGASGKAAEKQPVRTQQLDNGPTMERRAELERVRRAGLAACVTRLQASASPFHKAMLGELNMDSWQWSALTDRQADKIALTDEEYDLLRHDSLHMAWMELGAKIVNGRYTLQ
jgi:hypothetical protein